MRVFAACLPGTFSATEARVADSCESCPAGKLSQGPGETANSTYKFVCVEYCPTQGKFAPSVEVGDGKSGFLHKVTDRGAETVTQMGPGAQTKVTEHFEWTQYAVVVPIGNTDMWVDTKANPPAPFVQHQVIQIMGTVEANANESFYQYTPGNMSEWFDIKVRAMLGPDPWGR